MPTISTLWQRLGACGGFCLVGLVFAAALGTAGLIAVPAAAGRVPSTPIGSAPSARHGVSTASSGTAVCGNITADTTWSAAGSPYELCPAGVVIQSGARLLIDGAAGPVEVVANGFGGITVSGGELASAHTSISNDVVFTSTTLQQGSWGGIAASGPPACVVLSHARIEYASMDVGCATTLIDVDVAHTDRPAITSTTSLRMTRGAITDGTGSGVTEYPPVSGVLATGTVSIQGTIFSDLSNAAVSLSALQSLSIQQTKISRSGTSGAPAVYIYGLTASVPVTFSSNVITKSGMSTPAWPAVYIQGSTLDFNAFQGNEGSGNGIDAVACVACSATSSFTWESAPPSAGLHPLSFITTGLYLQGNTLTVPANGVVKTGIGGGINDGSVVATAGGAVFTSLSDNAVGVKACPSVLVASCTPGPGDWQGIWIDDSLGSNEHVQLTGATLTYAALALDIEPNPGSDAAGTPGADAMLNGVTIAHGFGGVGGLHASIAVNGGQIMDMVDNPNPITTSPPSPLSAGLCGFGIQSIGGNLGVTGVQVSDTTESGISERGYLGHGLAVIAGNTVTRVETLGQHLAGQGAIAVDGAASASVQNNTVTDSGHGTRMRSPAIYLGFMSGDLEQTVSGNVGDSNNVDGIVFNSFWDSGSFTWVSPSDSTTLHPLGYLGVLSVNGPHTLTIPAGAFVKATIKVAGATLDATAGAATFTGYTDSSLPSSSCRGQPPSSCTASKTNNAAPLTAVADPQGDRAQLRISNATLENCGTAIHASDADVNLTNDSFDNCSAALSLQSNASAVVSGGDFADATVIASDSSLQVSGATFSGAAGSIVFDNGPLSVASSTFSGATTAISVGDQADQYSISNSRFTGGGIPIWVDGGTVDFGHDFSGNLAWGNSFDGIDLVSTEVVSDFTWPVATPDSSPHPLYLEAQDGLTVLDATMTVAANATVDMDYGWITIEGGVLDGTAGGAVFSGTATGCQGPCFSGIQLTISPGGGAGSASLVDATLSNAAVGVLADSGGTAAPGDKGYGLHMVGGVISHIEAAPGLVESGDGLIADDTAIDVDGTSFDTVGNAAVYIEAGGGSRINELGSMETVATGVLDGGSVSVGDVAISNVGTAVHVLGAATASVQCSTITNNGVGIVADSAATTTVTDSNLTGEQNGADVSVLDPTYAEGNWWGQPGGPRPGQTQGPVDASNPLGAPSNCAPASPVRDAVGQLRQ